MRTSPAFLARHLIGLLVVELAAVYFFMIVRAEYLVAGIVAVAGAYVAAVAALRFFRSLKGLAWPFTFLPTQEREGRPVRRDAEFAFLTGRVDSYLSNRTRADEVHPVIVAIVQDRLRAHHGVDLSDRAAATPLLGDDLAAYVYNPPAPTLQGRSYNRLSRLLTRIEGL